MNQCILGKKESSVSYIFALVFILLMIAVAVLFKDREIILPEVAALTVGIFTFREDKWIQRPFHIFLLPSITAILGFGINFLPILFSLKLLIVLIGMLLTLRLFKSQLAPALATGLLPIVTNAHSFLFLFAIFAFVLVLYCLIKVLKIKPIEDSVPIIYISHNRWLIAICVIWFLIAYFLDYVYYSAIPPVIVIAFESLNHPSLKLNVRLKRILALTGASLIGCLTIQYLDNLILAGLIDLLLVAVLLKVMNLRLPPAFAMVLLPMIMPKETILHLTLATFLMSTYFMIGIYIIQKKKYPNPIDL
ncbi:hypothetical protein SAMN05443634_101251 [Chishuiella changwenlii]|uniref:HPP family protein n=2 Tax=Chishuiella changwenlii TaxID=1434701 RepID=A0A1M6T3R2_9FLAO|nr:hypothetical protein [Chishuiella changwenlii]SHK51653.1 hypothetical protein SAMN05443634_101251 [Chishuiella changwenlii]